MNSGVEAELFPTIIRGDAHGWAFHHDCGVLVKSARMIARIACTWMFLVVCAIAQSPSEQAVLEADRAFNQATQQKRLEGWMSFMAENVVLFGQNPPVVGKDAVRKFYEPQFSNASFSLTWDPTRGEIQPSGTVGYTTGRWTMKITGRDAKPVERHGTYLTVWGKQADGSWKVIADGGSPDPVKK